jgi:hypothetical protein
LFTFEEERRLTDPDLRRLASMEEATKLAEGPSFKYNSPLVILGVATEVEGAGGFAVAVSVVELVEGRTPVREGIVPALGLRTTGNPVV